MQTTPAAQSGVHDRIVGLARVRPLAEFKGVQRLALAFLVLERSAASACGIQDSVTQLRKAFKDRHVAPKQHRALLDCLDIPCPAPLDQVTCLQQANQALQDSLLQKDYELECLRNDHPPLDQSTLKLSKLRTRKLSQKRESVVRLEQLLAGPALMPTFEILLSLNELKTTVKQHKAISKIAANHSATQRIILIAAHGVKALRALHAALATCCAPFTQTNTPCPAHIDDIAKLVFDSLAWLLPDLQELLLHQTKVAKSAAVIAQVDSTMLELESQLSNIVHTSVMSLKQICTSRSMLFFSSKPLEHPTDPEERYASLLNVRIEERITEGLLKLSSLNRGPLSSAVAQQSFIATLSAASAFLDDAAEFKPSAKQLPRLHAMREAVSFYKILSDALAPIVHFKHDGSDRLILAKFTHRLSLALDDRESPLHVLGEVATAGLVGIMESITFQTPSEVLSLLL